MLVFLLSLCCATVGLCCMVVSIKEDLLWHAVFSSVLLGLGLGLAIVFSKVI